MWNRRSNFVFIANLMEKVLWKVKRFNNMFWRRVVTLENKLNILLIEFTSNSIHYIFLVENWLVITLFFIWKGSMNIWTIFNSFKQYCIAAWAECEHIEQTENLLAVLNKLNVTKLLKLNFSLLIVCCFYNVYCILLGILKYNDAPYVY